GDGRLDLLVTNFAGEYATLYHQNAQHRFEDVSGRAGLVEATGALVGFGVGLEDLDLDGWPDLFMASGHVSEDAEKFYEGVGLAQPKLILRNDGTGQFSRVASP